MPSIRLTFLACLFGAWCSTLDGHLYDVACPGDINELQCPEGHVIKVVSVGHGSKDDADCAARNQAAKVSHQTCILEFAVEMIKMICNYSPRCQLPRLTAESYACEYSEDNFVQITYTCHEKEAPVHTAVACDGEKAEITCEHENIKILKATFGRSDDTTCTHGPPSVPFCTSLNAELYVRFMCHDKKGCQIEANSENLGEPKPTCDGKYLTVDYICK